MSSRAVASSSMTRTQSALGERRLSDVPVKLLALRLATGRQADSKDRAFAWLACHRHVAPHHARELAGHGQAKAGSPVLPRGRRVGLREFFKELGLLLGSHADARIGHGDLDPVAAVDYPFDAQLNLTLLGE